MSLLESGQSAYAWAKTVALVLLVAGLAVVCVAFLGERKKAMYAQWDLAAEREAHAVDAADLARVKGVDVPSLQSQLATERAASATFRAAADEADRKYKAVTIALMHASTGPVPAQSPPQPVAPPTPAARCLLYEGEQGEIVVRDAVRRADHGTKMVVGSAEAFAASPRRYLFGGAYEAQLTEAEEITASPQHSPGPAAGFLLGLANGKPSGTLFCETAPAKVWLVGELSAAGTLTLSSGGDWGVAGGLVKHF